MSENLDTAVERFLEHKRALGRKYHSEEHELRLLVRFAGEHHARRLGQLTPALLEDFLASRPRSRPRSFNHLLGVVAACSTGPSPASCSRSHRFRRAAAG